MELTRFGTNVLKENLNKEQISERTRDFFVIFWAPDSLKLHISGDNNEFSRS
jgi:hypothetical protein